jgi:hypothetical protein
MSYSLQQGSTTAMDFLMVLASDHITGATGKTVTVTICKSGGSFAASAGSVSEISSGWYRYSPTAAETNTVGPLLLHASALLCDPRDASFYIVNYNPSVVLPSSPPTSATFGTIRALDLINNACDLLNIKAMGETLTQAEAQSCFGRLNRMIDSWGLQPSMMPNNRREVFDLVADQANYTIGPGGDFDTTRPIWITGAGLLQNSVSPAVEIPRPVINNSQYEAIQIKDFGSTYFTQVYYNMTYASGLGTITLWPVPTVTTNQLVIYSDQAIPGFSSLTAQYVFPPGYTEAIEDNLALRIAAPFGREIPAEVKTRAAKGLAAIKRANTADVQDLAMDPALLSGMRRPYNILSDQGGG